MIELYKNKKNRPSRNDNERQLPRHGRQEFREPRQIEESCETTGYETQIREDCKTLVETVCNNVTVTRFRPDIDEKCTTRVSKRIQNSLIIQPILRLIRSAGQPKQIYPSANVPPDMKRGVK